MTVPGNFSSGDVLTAADMNALPNNAGGYDFVASQNLTSSWATCNELSFTSPAQNRLLQVTATMYVDNVQAGGRIVYFRIEKSTDGGSSWSNLQTADYWVTWDTNDQIPMNTMAYYETASQTNLAFRTRIQQSSGTMGIVYGNYLGVTDVGAA